MLDYHFEYRKDPNVRLEKMDGILGYYDTDYPQLVFLNESSDPLQLEVTYWHESTHRRCFLTNCHCFAKSSGFWQEYHAICGEWEHLVRADNPLLWDCWERWIKSLGHLG